MSEEKIAIQPIVEFKAYSKLWDFFNQEHGLMLLNSQMDDILTACEQFKIDCNIIK